MIFLKYPNEYDYLSLAVVQVDMEGQSTSDVIDSLSVGKFNQTCVERPPSGPRISGRCWLVVVIQRWSLAQVWLYVHIAVIVRYNRDRYNRFFFFKVYDYIR